MQTMKLAWLAYKYIPCVNNHIKEGEQEKKKSKRSIGEKFES